jgi:hypothetical protein
MLMFPLKERIFIIQGGSNVTGTNCDLFTHKSSRSYLNHLVPTNTHNNLVILYYIFCAFVGICNLYVTSLRGRDSYKINTVSSLPT